MASSKGLVLIAEDELSIQKVLNQAFLRQEFTTLVCSNGKRALEEWERNGPAIRLLVTDINMPEMRGDELIRSIRASGGTIPIIIVSSERVQFPEDKNIRILGKPVRLTEIIRTAEEMILEESV